MLPEAELLKIMALPAAPIAAEPLPESAANHDAAISHFGGLKTTG